MRICILAPSPDYRTSAGSRIRYLRLESLLKAMGHSLEIKPISDFKGQIRFDRDVYLLSKCYDTRGLTVARLIRDSGRLLGVDFFDDNFSQTSDARLADRRAWMQDIAAFADFALCSTPRMREVVGWFWPQHPAHVLNDPYRQFDPRTLASVIETKLERLRSSNVIDVAWFGQGDNTRFPVGLRDLAAFGGPLSALAGERFEVRLRVLTNRRALGVEGLERLGRLNVPFRVDEWSEQAEADLLDASLVAFLPVNGQSFSVAKSLNRGLSALTRGTQVLSNGYPLYEPLGPFIYGDAPRLRDDLAAGMPALRGETASQLVDMMASWGDPAIEAARLAAFLTSALVRKQMTPPSPPEVGVKLAVLHGRESPNDTHRSIQRLGHLSVAGPLSRAGPAYDVVFQSEDPWGPCALLTEAALNRLATDLRPYARPAPIDADRWVIPLPAVMPENITRPLMQRRSGSLTRDLAAYPAAMKAAQAVCDLLFPDTELFISESDAALPSLTASRRTVSAPA